ncbi:50S ribosomal protein L1 [Candidatus Korarchaeum cryptofilum]|jgi:large subunit ribosomal protein L1|uniref:Large ribosomal subunit protein uL1 n=1 Tax=Korarchaeum cryptofilum (strain OPF8) TaxID=374847 RepID=RL1_KORCO|nr:50S ribosomal protein L1 [Candidatus Korarchaeum cryptofilum]B1L6L3.1 RecName: Full=Large ribosomal subunit protein uL1; AltName: Full=50S ribosomal protein L1 [Candidatus Korarchaeum cryptofilum OPF8]ACB08092.1 ribosomal protein L1 [Candidatus Korarchaeum cryptofilum OPF8]
MSKLLTESDSLKVIRRILEGSPKRRFNEAVDLVVVLRGIDLKRDPNAKINEVVELPHSPRNRKTKVAVIGKGEFLSKAKEAGADRVLEPEEIEAIAANKRALKKLANEYDFFIAQADVLPKIVKYIGPVLGPRNKMPINLPAMAVSQLPDLIEKLRRSVRIRTKDQPIIHTKVGSRDMKPEEIVENIRAVLSAIERKYEDPSKISRVYVKTTMGPAEELPLAAGRR